MWPRLKQLKGISFVAVFLASVVSVLITGIYSKLSVPSDIYLDLPCLLLYVCRRYDAIKTSPSPFFSCSRRPFRLSFPLLLNTGTAACRFKVWPPRSSRVRNHDQPFFVLLEHGNHCVRVPTRLRPFWI
jgi:hypothetical protein